MSELTDEQRMTDTRAKQACRAWAKVRVALLPLFDANADLRAFDEQMFRLGEVVWEPEGEVVR